MASIQVSGAIASKNGVTLFTPQGESMVYGQDSWRTGDILQAVLIPLAQSGGQPITVEIEQFSLAKAIEQATNGAVKVEEKIEEGVSKVALQIGNKSIAETKTLADHIERAAYEGSPGLGKFLEEYAKVDHLSTSDEVLRFMEKVDLPLADDGCIILYKFLDKHPTKAGYYVDHHTKKVEQRIGSRVYMELADYSKSRAECASGLHVCAKDYGQYGSEVLLVKVRPTDVVAVPDHESSKMRVLAYHIVARLNDEAHKAVADKRSALTAKGTKGIVAEIVAGQHIGVIEEVKVGKMGAFEVKVLAADEQVKPTRNAVRKLKAKPAKIDPKEVKEAIKAAKAVQAPSPAPKPKKDSFRAAGPTGQATDEKQAEVVKNAARIKEGRREEKPVQSLTPEYRAKLDKAQEMLSGGATLRQIDAALGMCRKSLARHIALGNLIG
jgi:hypothetical protein